MAADRDDFRWSPGWNEATSTSHRSPEWQAIRGVTLVRSGYRCEFFRVEDRSTIVRGEDDTFMTLRGGVFDENTGEFLPTVDLLSYRGRFVGIVVAGHVTHISAIPSGFGVSIFFVISGFLITRLLLAEMDRTGSIDLVAFYRRRAFRLFPAIVTAIVVATAAQVGHWA